jgi:hypothetical protein
LRQGAQPRDLAVFHPGEDGQSIIGRVAGKGLADELYDRGYLVVNGIDGKAHYVALELTRFRGHIILCVQGVANVQSTTAVPGAIPPADGRAGSSGPLSSAALA